MNNTDRYRKECGRIRASEEWKRKTADRMALEAAGPGKRRKGFRLAWTSALAAVLVLIFIFSPLLNPVTTQAKDLMEGIVPRRQAVPSRPDSGFITAQASFAVKLLQKTAAVDKNALISPASAALALGMAANGAEGETLSQFEALLGGGAALSSLNKDFASEQKALKSVTSGELLLTNSIWYRKQNLTVEKPFLQNCADWFGAAAFQLDFSDQTAPDTINAWVSGATDRKIGKIVDRIDPTSAMFLINTLYLEQDWKIRYTGSRNGVFHAAGGDRNVKIMSSMETYLHDGEAEGILKPLKDTRYAFAAVLPDEKTGITDYLRNLTGEKFLTLMRSGGNEWASAAIPKFKFDCAYSLNGALKALGLSDAFDAEKADFSGMGSSPDGNLFVSEVLQKTLIQTDEKGLKAGAVTSISMAAGSSRPDHILNFDRPFVIAVIDTETRLPLFLGVVADPSV